MALQRARLMARDGIDAALADRMIAAQASREQRLAIADDVVVNDGDPMHLEARARELAAKYVELSS
ncbi:Dephospho-CoA kinase [compost metagenome]